MTDKLVLAGPASEELGRSVAEKLGVNVLDSEFKVFPDGESKFTVHEKVAHRNILLVQSTYPPVDQHMMQLLLAAHHLSQEGARVVAVVPYLAYARQDKEFLPGEGITLGAVARLMRSAGIRRLVTVDVHSTEGLALFSFPIYSVSAIPSLASYVKENLSISDPVVIAPDFGASKRTEAFAALYGAKFLQLSKSRDRSTGEVKVKETTALDVKGKDVLIVDDIISTGGTVKAAAETVLGQGASKAIAVCVHPLMVGDAAEKLERAGVKDIVGTNTVAGKYGQVDVADTIASHLKTIDE
ncbi:MAG: ribose-phosphate pyrophosphokinase [Nitrososphaerota archaeon]|nr:ribose-phosphate pyrophosphokinase [Nitrososphaerota archaeon]